MAVTDEFKDAVQKRNFSLIRRMMGNVLIYSPVEFRKMEQEAYKNGIRPEELYEVHDGISFQEAPWNDAYMNKVSTDLDFNFSKERAEHLIKVVSVLHSEAPKKPMFTQKEEEGIKVGAGTGALIGLVGAALATAAPPAAIPLIIATGITTGGVTGYLTNHNKGEN